MNMNNELAELLAATKKILQYHSNLGIQAYPETGAQLLTAEKTAEHHSGKHSNLTTSPTDSFHTTKQQISLAPRSTEATLDDIKNDMAVCRGCPFHEHRLQTVFGQGDDNADLMIIGDHPNEEEEALAQLYKGDPGELLGKMLQAIQMTPQTVYYTTLTKCRPPKQDALTRQAIKTCLPYLYREIEAVKPHVIWALGSEVAQALLKTDKSLLQLRGRFHNFNNIFLMPTFHPDAMLKNEELKKPTWHDMQMILKKLLSIREKK